MWKTFRFILAGDSTVRYGVIWAGLLLILILVITAIWGWRLPPEIPIFYSLPQGSSQLAVRGWFFILPVSGLIFYILALISIGLSVNLVRIFPQITIWLTAVNLLLMAIAIIHILMLVA